MKKLWLSGVMIVLYSYVIGQQITTLGTTTRITKIVGTSIRFDMLKSTFDSANKVLTIIDNNGTVGYVARNGGSGGYTLPAASHTIRGGVKVDNVSTFMSGDTIKATPGAGEPPIPVGLSTQYWRGDKTFQSLVMAALGNWPNPTGHGGLFLTTDGVNYTWAAASGGSGLTNAYASMTDGTNTSTSSGATTFKYRSANNLLSFLITDNDITHGDNLLATINQGNFVLTESQITSLVSDLAGKEPVLSPGTNLQYYRGDKTWQTLNTSVVPETGGILYYTDLRVQTYGNTQWSLLTHNHTLDGLSNVSITSKQVNDILKWNGANWVNVPIPVTSGSPTITLGGDATGSYSSPNLPVTIAAGAISNSKMANMNNATIKGRITSGAGVPEDLNASQVKTMLALDQVPNLSNANLALSNADIAALALKIPITNGSPLGVFDASGATNVKLPRNTDATLQKDTIDLFTFGGGSGNVGDTLWVNTSTLLGSIYHSGTDTLVITNLNFIVQGTSSTITVTIKYGTNLNSGGTEVITGGTVVTNTTTGANVTSFNSAKIPPGNQLYCIITGITVGLKPIYFQVTGAGYKTRK